MRSRPAIKAALLVFAFSLALRLGWAAFAHVTQVRDFRDYHKRAIDWLDTGRLGWETSLARRTPAYPGFLAAVYAVAGCDARAVAIAQAVLGAATSGLIVLLAGCFLSVRTSVIAGVLHSVSPTALPYVSILASENLAIPLMLAGLTCVALADRWEAWRSHLALALSALLFGFLLLTRPAALFFLPAWLFLVLYSPQRRVWRLWAAPAFICTMVVVLTPWLVRNYRIGLGPFTLATVGGVNLWMANNDLATTGGGCRPALWKGWKEEMSEKEQDVAYRAAALEWIQENPRRYLALCRTRLCRLLGTEPDGWALMWLVPTAENGRVTKAIWRERYGGEPATPETRERYGQLIRRNRAIVVGYRAVLAPLAILGLVLSLLRWRTYAVFVLPAACYLGGLSFYYVTARLREMADPLLMVPLAALLADVFFGTRDLGRFPRRRAKAIIAALAVSASVCACVTGLDQGWYSLPPYSVPPPQLPACKFVPVGFEEPAKQYRSRWDYRTDDVSITLGEDGLRCEITGSADTSGGQYGGVRFGVSGFKALRLDLAFLEPQEIDAVYVDGYDAERHRVVRWWWKVTEETTLPAQRTTYALVPGRPSAFFAPGGDCSAASVVEIHVFVRIIPGSSPGFTLHRLEVGE